MLECRPVTASGVEPPSSHADPVPLLQFDPPEGGGVVGQQTAAEKSRNALAWKPDTTGLHSNCRTPVHLHFLFSVLNFALVSVCYSCPDKKLIMDSRSGQICLAAGMSSHRFESRGKG
ncbi:hypothetical protein GN956_G22326 [Arapaima gigas]